MYGMYDFYDGYLFMECVFYNVYVVKYSIDYCVVFLFCIIVLLLINLCV